MPNALFIRCPASLRRSSFLTVGRPLVIGCLPGLVRIVFFHCLESFERFRSKILFVNNSVWTNGECFHSRYTILGGSCRQRETADHRAIHYEIHLAKRRGGALA